ncbi:MAG: tRNA (adenosine(37)-N6)-dimethylallyltransferase MiaA [Chloroflexi bacterium]|jgi:tRNA dimethylallyltransferase|nr:tRNA (adenosine(37)-N6)-dimethylallyltransferase MiaA [Chloroflexota bacterium]MBT7082361.1 tRNA (adenosine(37)-N6)-dimethylallyltransferase MiaA [Chloroflexota bacterium]MBT7289188.1 tRNA (adenosine(37)-N6)-dimethylallyltransferase MiaA [Chloroflexota bacterium]
MSSLIAIVGPTAIGKSSVAIQLAKSYNGEIVSADSCQVYRYMDIGTAKPSLDDQKLTAHHLIDVIDPDQPFDLATYQKLAYKAIDDIHKRGKLAILVGGSGLYVRAILRGYAIPTAPPDNGLRESLERKTKAEGHEVLFAELQRIDPDAARSIDGRNVRRVIRAIEVYKTTGQPYSQQAKAIPPAYDILTVGLNVDREQLYRRIDSRVDAMIEEGLVDEVKNLAQKGYSFNLTSLRSLGYRQIGEHLSGQCALNEATDKIKYETHRFARHQYAWFKPKDKSINWYDINDDTLPPITDLVKQFLAQQK